MKKAIILLLIILPVSAIWSFGQKKQKLSRADSDTIFKSHPNLQPIAGKDKYNYFVIVPLSMYQTLVSICSGYRQLTTYSPSMTTDEKNSEQQGVDFLLNRLPKSVKLDSVKVIKK